MPFGLSNTPSAFQHFMNDVFSDLLDVCIVVYLDDLLIYSPDSDTHVSHVRKVLRCLRKHGLFAKAEKCEFHSTSVEYLGYVLSPGGLTMAQDKIKMILDWPELRKVKDIQLFLGFVNFYHHFILCYSYIDVLLTCLTHKNTPWVFDDSCHASFTTLKTAFTCCTG